MIRDDVKNTLAQSPWMVRADKSPFRDSITLNIFRYRPEKPHIEIVRGFTTDLIEEDSEFGRPALAFGALTRPGSFFSGAQELMDDLWRCGLRPSEAGESAGALSSTKFHLEDMRKLVFDKWLRR